MYPVVKVKPGDVVKIADPVDEAALHSVESEAVQVEERGGALVLRNVSEAAPGPKEKLPPISLKAHQRSLQFDEVEHFNLRCYLFLSHVVDTINPKLGPAPGTPAASYINMLVNLREMMQLGFSPKTASSHLEKISGQYINPQTIYIALYREILEKFDFANNSMKDVNLEIAIALEKGELDYALKKRRDVMEVLAVDNAFWRSFYFNDTQMDKLCYQWVIAADQEEATYSTKSLKRRVAAKSYRSWGVGAFAPSFQESYRQRAGSSIFMTDYHPQKRSRIPFIKTYTMDGLIKRPTEISMGAAVNVTSNQVEGNFLFMHMLLAQADEQVEAIKAKRKSGKEEVPDRAEELITADELEIEHVSFNLLKHCGRAPTCTVKGDMLFDNYEGMFCQVIDNYERIGNIAVITLPADNKWFNIGMEKSLFGGHKGIDLGNRERLWPIDELRKSLISSVMLNRNHFHISRRIRDKLTAKGASLEQMAEQAFTQALEKLHLDKKKTLTDAERQAVLFHAIKYEMTESFIKILNPKSYNITCKDAIDRAAVHTLYHRINYAIDNKLPLTEAEFLTGLQSAAIMVKSRALNHHEVVIWNALFHRVQGMNKSQLMQYPFLQKWLITNVVESNTQYKGEIVKSWTAGDMSYRELENYLHQLSKALPSTITPARAAAAEKAVEGKESGWVELDDYSTAGKREGTGPKAKCSKE